MFLHLLVSLRPVLQAYEKGVQYKSVRTLDMASSVCHCPGVDIRLPRGGSHCFDRSSPASQKSGQCLEENFTALITSPRVAWIPTCYISGKESGTSVIRNCQKIEILRMSTASSSLTSGLRSKPHKISTCVWRGDNFSGIPSRFSQYPREGVDFVRRQSTVIVSALADTAAVGSPLRKERPAREDETLKNLQPSDTTSALGELGAQPGASGCETAQNHVGDPLDNQTAEFSRHDALEQAGSDVAAPCAMRVMSHNSDSKRNVREVAAEPEAFAKQEGSLRNARQRKAARRAFQKEELARRESGTGASTSGRENGEAVHEPAWKAQLEGRRSKSGTREREYLDLGKRVR
jgi:hypothetical protein